MMPYGYGWGRMLRLRGGAGLARAGCPRRLPFGRGLIGTAASIVAGLALNDLANPDGVLRGAWRRIMGGRNSVPVIGYDTGRLPDKTSETADLNAHDSASDK